MKKIYSLRTLKRALEYKKNSSFFFSWRDYQNLYILVVGVSFFSGLAYLLGFLHQERIHLNIEDFGVSSLLILIGILGLLNFAFIVLWIAFPLTAIVRYVISSRMNQWRVFVLAVLYSLLLSLGAFFVLLAILRTDYLSALPLFTGGLVALLWAVGVAGCFVSAARRTETFLPMKRLAFLVIEGFWYTLPAVYGTIYLLFISFQLLHQYGIKCEIGCFFAVSTLYAVLMGLGALLVKASKEKPFPTSIWLALWLIIVSMLFPTVRNTIGKLALEALNIGGYQDVQIKILSPEICKDKLPAKLNSNKIVKAQLILKTRNIVYLYFPATGKKCAFKTSEIRMVWP